MTQFPYLGELSI